MSEDKLTPEERECLESMRRCDDYPRLLAALDRLAPRPKPPEPRVSELPARWRKDAFTEPTTASTESCRRCADELEAALQRESTRLVRCPVCAESYEASALLESP